MFDRKITRIIAYYRLSKKNKGRSKAETAEFAYGIQAQKAAVEYLRQFYGAEVVKEYTEIETGTSKRTRPVLEKAIGHAKLARATLVIAKLDRLARNVYFTAKLLEEKADFVCCDNPNANTTTIQMYSVMAEDEARRIAQRTREGLAVAKDKGVKLGSARKDHWKGREHLRGFKQANVASIEVRQANAKNAYSFLIEDMLKLRKTMSIAQIAEWLNNEGHSTTRGSKFGNSAVHRIFEMFSQSA